MSLFQVGRLAVKIAGRDAGRKCVVVKVVDDSFVMIDGDVRRKKVNLKHLEPLSETIEISDDASHDEVKKAFEKLGLSVWDKKSKKPVARPRKQTKVKAKPEADKKGKKAKKEEKKEAPKVEAKEETKKEEPKEPAKEAEKKE